jgi:hypothetical protein
MPSRGNTHPVEVGADGARRHEEPRGDLLLAQSLRGQVGLPPVVAMSAAASAGGDSGASPVARRSASRRACQAPAPNLANASEALRNSVRDEPRRRVRPRN